jgi:uncharacterized protein (DUF1501 family)
MFTHPRISRRTAVQAGAIGLLGLGLNHLEPLRAMAKEDATAPRVKAKSVIYIFLSGGLAQQDSFDPKPDAPAETRGEFASIATNTTGVRICEHLPMLAARSNKWALVRSLTHSSNDHSAGHMIMLSGRSQLPPGFSSNAPKPTDWPSIAAIANGVLKPRNNLPPAIILPEKLIHRTGRVIPGQFAGQMGSHREPWIVTASPFNANSYGAYPEYEFHFEKGRVETKDLTFQTPNLSLPPGQSIDCFTNRLELLNSIDAQRRELEQAAAVTELDRYRAAATSLLLDPNTRKAFDVLSVDDKLQERYGKNSFGWSLLMARQLVEAGVSLVQVNLGNNETWDTHQAAFPTLKDFLLPPTDRAVSALLDDLEERGLLDDTLVVMAGEFGRTPRIPPPAKKTVCTAPQ